MTGSPRILLVIVFVFISVLTGCGGGSPVTPGDDFATLTIKSIQSIASPPAFSYDPQIAVNPSSGEIFCLWCRKIGSAPEIMWRHGQPGSLSGEEPVTEVDNIRSWNPSITVSNGGQVYLAYMDMKIDGMQKEIYVKSWENSIWGDETMLSQHDGWTGWDPNVECFPDGSPAVCWFDHRYGVQHEILMRAGDGNGNWQPDIRLTSDRHWQYFPDISIDSAGTIHLTYVDTRHELDEWQDTNHYAEGRNLEIYYRSWSGAGVGPEVRVTDSALRSIVPQNAVGTDGTVRAVWLDETASGYYRLYYREIDDNGLSEIVAVSNPAMRADFSSIECLGNRTFIASVEYLNPGAPSNGETRLAIREIIGGNMVSEPLVIASGGTNIHPRMAVDPVRNSLWIIWIEYIGTGETFIEGESYIHLCRIDVEL